VERWELLPAPCVFNFCMCLLAASLKNSDRLAYPCLSVFMKWSISAMNDWGIEMLEYPARVMVISTSNVLVIYKTYGTGEPASI
jgi:hypothetical protein